MTAFFAVLVFIALVYFVSVISASLPGASRQQTAAIGELVAPEVAVSGRGLFYLFAPSSSSLDVVQCTGLDNVIINDPRLVAFQKSYGPVDPLDADNFANHAVYCRGTSEVVRPLGSIVAFAGRATEKPPLGTGFTRLIRLDGQGYQELCSGEEVSMIYLCGIIQDSAGDIFPASFFLSVLDSQLEASIGAPNLWGERTTDCYKTIEFQGLQLHPRGSDCYWVSERLIALSDALRWASDADRDLSAKFITLRQLAKSAQDNPLMDKSRSKINKALLETRNLCDQMPDNLRDLEKRTRDVFEWVLLPEAFKGGDSINESDFDLEELRSVKEKYEEVVSLVDLYIS